MKRQRKWQKYHTHQEGETDCGPACVRTVLRRHGILVDTPVLRESIGLGDSGSTLLSLRDALRGYGLDSELLLLDTAQLAQAVRIAGPAVILLEDEGYRHFVVVHAVTDHDDFLVSDPLFHRVRHVSATELASTFHGETLVTDRPAHRLTLRARFKGLRGQALLREAVSDHRRPLAVILLATAAVSLLALAVSLFVQVAVDHFMGGGSGGSLAALACGFIALTVGASGLQYARGRMIVTLGQKLQRQLSTRYTEKLLRLPLSFFRTRRTGDLVSRLDDVQEIQALVTSTAIGLTMDAFVVLTVGGYLLVVQPLLFLILIPAAAVNVLSSYALYTPIREAAEEALQRDATLKSEAVTIVQGHTELVSYGKRTLALSRITTALDRRIQSETRLGRLENLNAVTKLTTQAVFTIVVTWTGLLQVGAGAVTMGVLFGYLTMAGYFLSAMESIASLQVTLQRTSAALGRYRDIALQHDDPRLGLAAEDAEQPRPRGGIATRSLTLYHTTPDRPVVSGVDLDVPHGTSMLVRGRNGSGKSTLLKSLAGLHPDYRGRITLGGAELTRVPEEALRRQVLYVPETPVLLTASIRENLTLGTDRPDAEILDACRTACFLDVVEGLPDGLDHPLREGGGRLSRGQLQRLSLARAVLQAPDAFLFDESFSGIDGETLRTVWARLTALDATKIVVAHGGLPDAGFDLTLDLDSHTATTPHESTERALV
ncbi:peptidase domain-containing ABC transporter [Streptomyces sp. NPDC047928]|uniref:peptidase domain-containing ABC transporter n=1 Tax=unclassified Streptomyces TaxID=2593676 RepID=UPI00371D79C5